MTTTTTKKVNPTQSKEHMAKLNKMPFKKLPQYIYDMVAERDSIIESGEVASRHVYFSKPNSKGAPDSVSTIPVVDCPNCAQCKLQCYDMRHDCRNKQTRATRVNNSAILKADPERFFREINAYCTLVDKFRWHVGGDVKNLYYFSKVVEIAKNNPHCKFHIFTKNYEAVNEFISQNGGDKSVIPENLNLRLSGWKNLEMQNPYGLGTAEVVFDDEFVVTKPNSAICSKNCTLCAIHSSGCFRKSLETIYLPVH